MRLLLDTHTFLWFIDGNPLPFHHRDPFDRLLIAQATAEQMPIVSAGAAFDAYGVTRLW